MKWFVKIGTLAECFAFNFALTSHGLKWEVIKVTEHVFFVMHVHMDFESIQLQHIFLHYTPWTVIVYCVFQPILLLFVTFCCSILESKWKLLLNSVLMCCCLHTEPCLTVE